MVENPQKRKLLNLPPKRFRPQDTRTDRSDKYNKIHGTAIINNHMLDRYLRNKQELEALQAK